MEHCVRVMTGIAARPWYRHQPGVIGANSLLLGIKPNFGLCRPAARYSGAGTVITPLKTGTATKTVLTLM